MEHGIKEDADIMKNRNGNWNLLKAIPFVIDDMGFIHSEILVYDKGKILIDYKPPYKKIENNVNYVVAE